MCRWKKLCLLLVVVLCISLRFQMVVASPSYFAISVSGIGGAVKSSVWGVMVALILSWTPRHYAEVVTFYYTGAPQTFNIPSGTVRLFIFACGAQGARICSSSLQSGPLPGGCVSTSLDVRSIKVVYIYVGQSPPGYGSNGGWNGGGSCSTFSAGWRGSGCNEFYGCAGGGATDVRTSSTLESRIVVAGGGGGCVFGCWGSCGAYG